MQISNQHNLVDVKADTELRFGIRATLPKSDPFRRLLPDTWETYQWFATAAERDRALEEMSTRHRYSRIGDIPTVNYEPLNR